jgi:IS5 family transposase
MLERHEKTFSKMPPSKCRRWLCLQGQPDNGKRTEGKGCGLCQEAWLTVMDMAKSTWVYEAAELPRRDQANISTLKRAFGLDRCTWKGWDGFKSYVWSSIFAYNLQVIARIKLEAA